MSVRSYAATSECTLAAQGVIAAPLNVLPALREDPGGSVRRPIPPRFLRHSDEQTVVGLAAVLRAMDEGPLRDTCFDDWGVVAAPMFPGRLGGAATFRKYQQGGPAAISPHIIPQNSLHSVSSAISISLAMRGPNFGIGGGPEALAEGLTVAMTLLDTSDLPGLWLVLTQWAPEPVPDGQGSTQTETICLAVALGLLRRVEHDARGMTLRLTAAARPEAIGRQIRVVSEAEPGGLRRPARQVSDSGPGGLRRPVRQVSEVEPGGLRRPARQEGESSDETGTEGGPAGRSNLPRLVDLARWLAGGPGGRAAPWSYCLPWGGRIELAESNYLQQTKAA